MDMKGEQMKDTTKKALLLNTIEAIINQESLNGEIESSLKADKTATSPNIDKITNLDSPQKAEILTKIKTGYQESDDPEGDLDNLMSEVISDTIKAVIDIYFMLKA